MKIKGKLYDRLETLIKSSPTLNLLEDYRSKGLSDKRWRWDLLWSSNDKERGELIRIIYDELDANDDHIDTALRKITGTK